MVDAPTGTVTFLFTDIEGSTKLWERAPEAMARALEDHDAIVRSSIEAHGGYVFATGGDGFAIAFAKAAEAVSAAQAAAGDLEAHGWPPEIPIKVRMGIHSGEVIERDGDYFGPAVNRAARLMAVAHGGQIVCSHATAAILGATITLKPLGEHRLRDLGAPELIFQIGDDTFPPLRSLDVHPTNLPVQLTSFVGREEELASLVKIIETARLVTLTGVGGVGKTRLAIQAAGQTLDRFADGSWIVELGPLSDPGAVGEVAAASIGVTPSPTQTSLEAFLGAVAGRDLLLVIDNCEHLLGAVADFIHDILRIAPGVRVLATSREALGVPGEQIVAVPALGASRPAGGGASENDDALRLMVERAMAVRPDLALTHAHRDALAEICQRLDGIPLAIELAAARLRAMTPEELGARLDQRFRLLTGGSRLAVDRHQTLRATIDWSYDLLDEESRQVLQAVSVFAGGFNLSGAEALVPEAEIEMLDTLTGLVDKSLVIADYVGATTRYRLLETVRDYALERLRAEHDIDLVRRRHAEYLAGFAQAAGAGLREPEERDWLDRVEQETENLRTAVIWAVETGDAQLATALVAPLTIEILPTERTIGGLATLCLDIAGIEREPQFPRLAAFSAYRITQQGNFAEADRLFQRAWAAIGPPTSTNAYVRSRVLCAEAISAFPRGNLDEAARLCTARVEAARESGDEYELCRALAMHALSEYQLGRDGRDDGRQAFALAQRLGTPLLLGSSLFALGQTTIPFDRAEAIRLFNEAEIFAIRGGNAEMQAAINGMRGHALAVEGDSFVAMAQFAEMLNWEWTERGHLLHGSGFLRLIAAGLAAMGGRDDSAALIY